MRRLYILIVLILAAFPGCGYLRLPHSQAYLESLVPEKGCNQAMLIASRADATCDSGIEPTVPGFTVRRLHACQTIENLKQLASREELREPGRDGEREQQGGPSDESDRTGEREVPGAPSGGGDSKEAMNRDGVGPDAGRQDDDDSSDEKAPGELSWARTLRRLETTFVLQLTTGTQVSPSDVEEVLWAGFSEPSQSCPVVALAEQGRAAAGKIGKLEDPVAWHASKTASATVSAPLWEAVRGADPQRFRVRVAVLDTGVDPEALSGNTPSAAGWSYTACGDDCWKQDSTGHGTAVANLVADASGGAAELLSIQVLGEQGIGEQEDLARGIAAAVEQGAELINLSLGYYVPQGRREPIPYYLHDALRTARKAHALVLAAAGNSCGPSLRFDPAGIPGPLGWNILSIGGLQVTAQPPAQVIRQGVEIWAPSEFICTRSSLKGHSADARASGTSLAVAQVTGALALAGAWKKSLEDRPGRSLTRPEWLGLAWGGITEPNPGENPPGWRLTLCPLAQAARKAGLNAPPIGSLECVSWEHAPGDPAQERCGVQTWPPTTTLTYTPASAFAPGGPANYTTPAAPYTLTVTGKPPIYCGEETRTAPPTFPNGGDDCDHVAGQALSTGEFDIRFPYIPDGYRNSNWRYFRIVTWGVSQSATFSLPTPSASPPEGVRFQGDDGTVPFPRTTVIRLEHVSNNEWLELPTLQKSCD